MIGFAVVLLTLLGLGVLTHFVPSMQKGRMGYPIHPSGRVSRSASELKDVPRTRESFELVFTPRREPELVACDQVGDGV